MPRETGSPGGWPDAPAGIVRSMDPRRQLPLAIHGPGKAGTVLGALLSRSGCGPVEISGGSAASRRLACALVPGAEDRGDLPGGRAGGLLLLAVPDDALAAAVATLAGLDIPGSLRVAHLAGRFGRGLLAPVEGRVLATAAFHPLCSLPSRESAGSLAGSVIGLDAPPGDVPFWEDLARRLGGVPVHVPEAARGAYHLAASVLGNGVQALADLAFRALADAGVDGPVLREGLVRLAHGALLAGVRREPAHALTGPVPRGDLGTLDAHRGSLASREDRELFEALVRAQFAMLHRIRDSQEGSAAPCPPPRP